MLFRMIRFADKLCRMVSRCLVALLAVLCPCVHAQQSTQPFYLVSPNAKGALVIPYDADWKISGLSLYDHGTRPAVQLDKAKSPLVLSLILFPNASSQPDPTNCREDVLQPLNQRFGNLIQRGSWRRSEQTTPSGARLALASYVLTIAPKPQIAEIAGVKPLDTNFFAFTATPAVCAEMHVSSATDKPMPIDQLQALLPKFQFQPDYEPRSSDYAKLGALLYRAAKDYTSAAVYYQRAWDTLPPDDPQHAMLFRYLTDQLAMSYGMSGDLAKSRAVNQAAIARDPEYPLYYYTLACADAEEGNAAAARTHLQQAFDRRANTLPGEKMPDPTHDDSIVKLKHDKAFWQFVQTLPQS
jgi:tetratricopeptide (TPR) repeat protein